MSYDWDRFKKTFNEIWMEYREDDEGYVDCLNDLMERIARMHGGEPSGIQTSLEFYIAHWGKEIPIEETTKKSMRSIYPVGDWTLALVKRNLDNILAVQVRGNQIIVSLKQGLDMDFAAHKREYKKSREKTRIELGLQGEWGMSLAELRWRVRRFENGIWR